MDYQGQRLAELIFYWIILSFGAVGWIIGYFQQDFMVVFKFWLVGVAISVVVRRQGQLHRWNVVGLLHQVNFSPLFISSCSDVFQTGHSTTGIQSSGSSLYQIDGGKNRCC